MIWHVNIIPNKNIELYLMNLGVSFKLRYFLGGRVRSMTSYRLQVWYLHMIFPTYRTGLVSRRLDVPDDHDWWESPKLRSNPRRPQDAEEPRHHQDDINIFSFGNPNLNLHGCGVNPTYNHRLGRVFFCCKRCSGVKFQGKREWNPMALQQSPLAITAHTPKTKQTFRRKHGNTHFQKVLKVACVLFFLKPQIRIPESAETFTSFM